MWVMLGLVVVSVVMLAVGLEYQRGWESMPEPLRPWLLARTYPPVGSAVVMVNSRQRSQLLKQRTTRRLRAATTKQRAALKPVAITQTSDAAPSNALLLQARADALAALVVAKKVGETEGLKLVFGVAPSSSSRTYQDARAALKAALAKRQRASYAPIKDGQQQPMGRIA